MKLKIKNDKYDIENFESFMSDIYDPIKFKQNIIRVQKPNELGGFDVVPFDPYSYQNMWSADTSTLKYAVKSRQIGFSFNEMVDSLHRAILTPNYLKMFVSLRQVQANELLTIVKNVIRILPPELQIPMISERDGLIKFENGSRLIALPAKESASRSFHGDVFIDEIAFIPNDTAVLESILSTTVRSGYNVAVGSTPYGRRGEFHKIAENAGWDTGSTWEEKSTAPEFLRRYLETRANNETEWSFHATTWWMCPDLHWERIIPRAPTRDSLLQEYGLGFLDETTAMLPYQLLMSRMDEELTQFLESRKAPQRRYNARRTAGLDPADTRDQTAFIVMERINGQYHKRFRKTWQGDPHTVYNPEVIKYMKSMGIQHLYMDTTGLGAPVYADLRKYLPESKITGVKFTTNSKADMVNNMVYL